MKARTFTSGNGTRVTTTDKNEIKRMKACGWREVEATTQVFAKGLENGNSFLK